MPLILAWQRFVFVADYAYATISCHLMHGDACRQITFCLHFKDRDCFKVSYTYLKHLSLKEMYIASCKSTLFGV